MAHPVFTPTAVPPERLDEVTVGRVDLIARLVTRLRDVATTGTRPHTLLVGPRGSGKTHLLGVVFHRARLDPAVDAGLAVAWVPEDALSIGSYEDLLVELVRVLDASREAEARELRRARNASGLERLLLEIAGDRVLVLVLENLDRIFAATGPAGQSALRGLVETSASVVLLASTPLLFSAVSSRDEPWYGSFDAEHLGDLTLVEGTDLLDRAASEAGDDALAAFIKSTTGQARLRAVEHLAGGSPRLWHILSGCITVETLDELVPAVEALLDELAPYYQQRLWELPATEQKLVVQLGREHGSRTVSQLADAVGISNRVAATALGRLSEARWVRGVKVPGTDQRSTWYELREPLLRHHLQYRDARGEPLRFIVEFLSIWYAEQERRRFLAGANPGSAAERHLVRTLLEGPPPRLGSAWADRDPDRLLVEARCWLDGSALADRLSGSPALGAALEAVILTACGSDRKELPASRPSIESLGIDDALRASEQQDGSTVERVGAGLRALASASWSTDDTDLVGLLSACWNGYADPAAARDALNAQRVSRSEEDGLLSLAIRDEHAYWTGTAGDSVTARELFATLVSDHRRALGPAHPHTLISRQHQAYWIGKAGDAAAARDLFATLVTDQTRALGPEHPDALTSRHNHAYWTGEAGDAATARDLFATLVTDYTGVLGREHQHTLGSRYNHAYWTGKAGDAAAASNLFGAVVVGRARVLGPDHRDTRNAQAAWLHWTLLSRDVIDIEAVQGIIGQLPQDDTFYPLVLYTVLASYPRPPGWRSALLKAAEGRLPVAQTDLERLGAALDGAPDALAELPAELRPIVQTLIDIDATYPSG